MRRLVLFAVAILVATACIAQPTDVEIIYSGMIPQIVVWDEVTTDASGDPLIEGDVITYEVFYRRSLDVDAVSLGVVTLPEATVDLSLLERGYYYIGVRSVGETAEGAVEYSDIAWSNDPVATDPTQRFAYLVTGPLLPAVPSGLRTVP